MSPATPPASPVFVTGYESLYYGLAWSNPTKAIEEIIRLLPTTPPSSEEHAGLNFLYCCLTQTRFETSCSCSQPPPEAHPHAQSHCYYDHLFHWFCVVADQRLQRIIPQINARWPSHPLSIKHITPYMKIIEKLRYIVDILLRDSKAYDDVLFSMFVTLEPYLTTIAQTLDPSLLSDIASLYNCQLGHLRHFGRPTYLRIAVSIQHSPSSPRSDLLISTNQFSSCDYITKCGRSNCPKTHDLSYTDTRGSVLIKVRLTHYIFHNTNCRGIYLINCSMDNIRIEGENNNFDNLNISPPNELIQNYCIRHQQTLNINPLLSLPSIPAIRSCFLPHISPPPSPIKKTTGWASSLVSYFSTSPPPPRS